MFVNLRVRVCQLVNVFVNLRVNILSCRIPVAARREERHVPRRVQSRVVLGREGVRRHLLGFRVWCEVIGVLGYRVWGLGCRIEGVGFRIQGVGLRV